MIDWGRVGELRDEVGADAFVEVVEIFLEEVNEIVDRMTRFPNPETLADDLHFLKGSALSLGFSSFADQCQKHEAQVIADGPASVALEALFQSFAVSKTEFLTYLSERTAA